jgi:hypothetical protein
MLGAVAANEAQDLGSAIAERAAGVHRTAAFRRGTGVHRTVCEQKCDELRAIVLVLMHHSCIFIAIKSGWMSQLR